MINIFIPIIENVEGFCEFIAKHKEKEAHIYVGIRKSLKEKFVSNNNNSNVEIHIFDDKAKKEEIINELQKIERQKGKLLVIRRPITDEEYTALTTSENEIATLRAHHNKFVTALKNFARKTIKKFFAFSFFEDISAICYSEFLHELISSCPNLSMATRINKYVGVDVGEIETQTTPVKKDYNKFKNAGLLSLAVFILGGSIAGAGCIFAFVSPIRAIFVVLVIAMLFVALTIFGILLVNYTRTITVGELEYKAAEPIEVIPGNFVVEEEEKPMKKSTATKAKSKTETKKKTTKTVAQEKATKPKSSASLSKNTTATKSETKKTTMTKNSAEVKKSGTSTTKKSGSATKAKTITKK